MGSETSTPQPYYHPRPPIRPILKKQTAYPYTNVPIQTRFPQYPNNIPIQPNQSNIPRPNYPPIEVKQNPPINPPTTSDHRSPPSEDRHHRRHHHHHRRHHHHYYEDYHHHPHIPYHADRATQTSPSEFFKVHESVIQGSLSARNDNRSTPDILRENWQPSLQRRRITPPFLRESSSTSSLDDYITYPTTKPPSTTSAQKRVSPAVVKPVPAYDQNRKN